MTQTTARPKPRLIPNVTIGERGVLSIAELRQAAQSDPQAFMLRMNAEIERGGVSFGKIRDLKGMFFALSDVQVPTTVEISDGITRSVMASAFPLLIGGLAVKGINDVYQAVPTIGQELVQDFEDPKRVTTFANVAALDKNVDTVKEGDDYPEINASEEKMEIRNKRNGRKLSITMELIEENAVGDIANRINKLGEIAADWTEEQTLDRVTDRYGSGSSPAAPYTYRPNGGGTQLYNSTANNPGTRAPSGTRVNNNALVDATDLDAARTVLAAMKNDRGKRIAIPINQCILLVPDALAGTAAKILNSEYTPGVENEVSNWGPRGQYRPRLVSSPKLDDISTTAWYLGQFSRQFMRKWKLRFEYVTLAGDTQAFLDKRVAFQARIGWDMEVGALDYVFAVQSLTGTTPP